jgi:hypothetical protein
VQDPATTVVGDHAILIGGLDQSDVSVADVVLASTTRAHRLGTLPVARHDAAAATLGGQAYVFGGGEPSFDEIRAVAADGLSHPAGLLPVAASDVVAATIGHTAYVVGGYTGTVPLNTIVAWSGHGTGRVVARLAGAVRYAAVASAGGRLIIAGGTNGVSASRTVYSFDPGNGRVKKIGRLPEPLAHAPAATLGGEVYVLGGRGEADNTQTDRILAIDPATGRVTKAGRLPAALSDAGAAVIAGQILLAGGRERTGTLSDRVYLLSPRA